MYKFFKLFSRRIRRAIWIYQNIIKIILQNFEDIKQPKQKNKHTFTTSLIIYKEPINPVGYGQNYRYDINNVNDFTDKLTGSNITLNDYKKDIFQIKKKIN